MTIPMKKLTRFLALALTLAMTLCLLPAAAADKAEDYEWLYSAKKKGGEECYAVQIGSWRALHGAKIACEELRSYGYEAFVYHTGNYRVCVGLFPDYEEDPAPAQELIDDLKTLTRASVYMTSCCSAYPTKVQLPPEKERFTAFGGEAPEATEEPVRTSIELQQPGKRSTLATPLTQYVDNPSGKRIYMYYAPDADAGICGYLSHGQKISVLAKDGKSAFVETENKRQGWVPTDFLKNEAPAEKDEAPAKQTKK